LPVSPGDPGRTSAPFNRAIQGPRGRGVPGLCAQGPPARRRQRQRGGARERFHPQHRALQRQGRNPARELHPHRQRRGGLRRRAERRALVHLPARRREAAGVLLLAGEAERAGAAAVRAQREPAGQAERLLRAAAADRGAGSLAGVRLSLPGGERARREEPRRLPQGERRMARVPRSRMRPPPRDRSGRCFGRSRARRLHDRAHPPPRARHEMTLEIYLAYVLACVLIAIVPGPTVTVIVANSLAHGTRAGLLNVAGTQLGLGLMMVILIVGLSSVIAAMSWLFDWLRIAGAIYLAYLGWKLIRAPEAIADRSKAATPRGGFLLQGFLVMMSNPKALFWFGAFIPQFVDPKGNYVAQIAFLGATAMVVALFSDGGYAVLTGHAGAWVSRKRL